MESVLSRLSKIQRAETVTGVPLVSGSFPPGEHDRVWRALRAEHSRTGLWPVLGSTAHGAAECSYAWTSVGPQGAELLALTRRIDPAERMALIVRSVWEDCVKGMEPTDPFYLEFEADFDPVRVAAAVGDLGETPARNSGGTDWVYPPTDVLLVPAAAGHEVLALVPAEIIAIINNWSGGPSHPDLEYMDHILVLQYWERRWGAQLYGRVEGTLELAVERPPSDPLSAAVCAIEQSAYCYDLAQTLGDVRDVASRQAPASRWTFWWD
ncbi:DUF4253 domain-containing protein [Actinoplanes regularis]|uniref:DUF4253 domain-containing protein n=1 Tax=Actinoplanes regularis TaxID=52697 RepID=A0A238YR39_9ACTN|nr:DUF4253 domain-containing protein [Actinoplanes regularis]GIE85471.1 hypothetical protein Are01nite_19510 [Actinoplanes regularis]SNR73268.1 protein of unknown function [Actinoplanes regularis]